MVEDEKNRRLYNKFESYFSFMFYFIVDEFSDWFLAYIYIISIQNFHNKN